MNLSLRHNLGTADRVLRIIAGLALIFLALFQPIAISGILNILLWIVGLFMIIEGLLGY